MAFRPLCSSLRSCACAAVCTCCTPPGTPTREAPSPAELPRHRAVPQQQGAVIPQAWHPVLVPLNCCCRCCDSYGLGIIGPARPCSFHTRARTQPNPHTTTTIHSCMHRMGACACLHTQRCEYGLWRVTWVLPTPPPSRPSLPYLCCCPPCWPLCASATAGWFAAPFRACDLNCCTPLLPSLGGSPGSLMPVCLAEGHSFSLGRGPQDRLLDSFAMVRPAASVCVHAVHAVSMAACKLNWQQLQGVL